MGLSLRVPLLLLVTLCCTAAPLSAAADAAAQVNAALAELAAISKAASALKAIYVGKDGFAVNLAEECEDRLETADLYYAKVKAALVSGEYKQSDIDSWAYFAKQQPLRCLESLEEAATEGLSLALLSKEGQELKALIKAATAAAATVTSIHALSTHGRQLAELSHSHDDWVDHGHYLQLKELQAVMQGKEEKALKFRRKLAATSTTTTRRKKRKGRGGPGKGHHSPGRLHNPPGMGPGHKRVRRRRGRRGGGGHGLKKGGHKWKKFAPTPLKRRTPPSSGGSSSGGGGGGQGPTGGGGLPSLRATAVVAKDGSGTHSSIQDAVDSVGSGSVIYIKPGTYSEQVTIKKGGLTLLGAGKSAVTIVASESVGGGSSTYKSATLGVSNGDGFTLMGVKVVNDAGRENHQAVAFRATLDKVAVYETSFEGFQDTLYTDSGRQYYKNVYIGGTVDFIFGDAAAVIEDAKISIHSSRAFSTVTASGRDDCGSNTGIVIKDAIITADSDVESGDAFLGRPWKECARTVFINCYLPGALNRDGWNTWNGGTWGGKPYYAEYRSSGPGAASSRAGWVKPGIISDPSPFTANAFAGVSSWIGSTTFPASQRP